MILNYSFHKPQRRIKPPQGLLDGLEALENPIFALATIHKFRCKEVPKERLTSPFSSVYKLIPPSLCFSKIVVVVLLLETFAAYAMLTTSVLMPRNSPAREAPLLGANFDQLLAKM